MTIRLRGHHLLCMLTYVGKGYSPAFVENYDTIADRLSKGEDILLIDGPDDICAPLICGGVCHCHNESVLGRDRLAIEDISQLVGQRLLPQQPFMLDAKRLASMRDAFADGSLRRACVDCEWHDLCTRIAITDNFNTVKVTRPPVST
ncbi:DUF1284 domain-containing protein [Brucella sp. BE17]|uniref:DUF1284 domain-containing protein n=1 Tax=Brucella sp. BE17 TaxID=3142977 RepID=UPI0031BA6AB0